MKSFNNNVKVPIFRSVGFGFDCKIMKESMELGK